VRAGVEAAERGDARAAGVTWLATYRAQRKENVTWTGFCCTTVTAPSTVNPLPLRRASPRKTRTTLPSGLEHGRSVNAVAVDPLTSQRAGGH
jgi:hypothetical protein